jgi:uncharacterized membrane protein YbhN (UPF0104 family)
VLSGALLVVLLAFVLPTVTGSDWSSAIETLALVTVRELAVLTVLWLVGVWAYTFVMAACLPGLRRAQAFGLYLAGSAVSNLVPVGGAVGVAVTWGMLRSYGHSHAAIGIYTAVTGLWNILARLALPAAGLAALLLVGGGTNDTVLTAAVVGVALTVVILLVAAALVHQPASDWVSRVTGRLVLRGSRLARRPAPDDVSDRLADLLTSARVLLSTGHVPIIAGMLAYVVLQGVLMGACLAAVGSDLGWAEVTAGYAVGRMLTTIILTPGGTGFTETGTAAVLVALGGEPAATMAGVLLFSFFTFVCEIPGGALAYAWHLHQTRPGRAWSAEAASEGKPS